VGRNRSGVQDAPSCNAKFPPSGVRRLGRSLRRRVGAHVGQGEQIVPPATLADDACSSRASRRVLPPYRARDSTLEPGSRRDRPSSASRRNARAPRVPIDGLGGVVPHYVPDLTRHRSLGILRFGSRGRPPSGVTNAGGGTRARAGARSSAEDDDSCASLVSCCRSPRRNKKTASAVSNESQKMMWMVRFMETGPLAHRQVRHMLPRLGWDGKGCVGTNATTAIVDSWCSTSSKA